MLFPLKAEVSNSIFKVDSLPDDAIVSITFYHNGIYTIEYTRFSFPDLPEWAMLSYGKYEENNEEVRLSDSLHGYTMFFAKEENNTLKAKSSFLFLMDKTIRCYMAGYTDPIKSYQKPQKSAQIIQDEIARHKKIYSRQNERAFEVGQYYGHVIANDDYMVSIQNDGNFNIQFHGVTLLQGWWSKEKNTIKLYDTILCAEFCLLIDKDCIIGKSLPGSFNDIILKQHPFRPCYGVRE